LLSSDIFLQLYLAQISVCVYNTQDNTHGDARCLALRCGAAIRCERGFTGSNGGVALTEHFEDDRICVSVVVMNVGKDAAYTSAVFVLQP